ncbi:MULTISPECIES: hypothetical protein [Pseudoalteromonas]|uniref:Uncharacterized protein n=1 Tax=Pseudoalteromonas peptidolytica F12-50-A1 TaxID=1315280 RepID=A0A8I0MV19_9GAMM|nr:MULTISPECIES: hypothetical protein [Pseudoalteromonas]MBE0345928.1 hypothetical protein [Pseudoalteromonas peptidolytica F12-50-A1]NLR14819.1 hypothetical protein [Pseudoalteromonas peptidolytica]GEK11593.1 hypothetical protein PPE03_38420 [Pseudoalteromonas peptidolytica]
MLGGILLNVLVTLLIVTSLAWTLFHWKVVLLGVQKIAVIAFISWVEQRGGLSFLSTLYY